MYPWEFTKSIILFLYSLISYSIFCSGLNGQEASKIKLRNVSVSESRLPTVFLFGQEFTARQRNTLLKEILSSRFYDPNFKMEVNFQEFISKRKFNFIHKGAIEVIINSSKLSNRNLFVTYHGASDIQMPNSDKINTFVRRVKEVYIDSSRNGILKREELKKEILGINAEINKLSLKKGKNNYETDSPFQLDNYLKKIERKKNRVLKRYFKIPIIQIKILTR